MEIKNKKHKLKNYNLIIFCSLSLCLLYYTNRTNVDIRKKLKNASTTIETLSLERALLLDNIMLHYTYNDKKIPNLLLYTIDGDSLHLSELLNDDYKLLIRFSQLNCSSCIDDIFEGLRQVVNKFPSNKVILIGTYDNQRVFQAFIKNYSLQYSIYYSRNSEDVLKEENIPYCCLINNDRILKNLMIPMKEIPAYSRRYYEIVLNRFLK